MTDLKFVEPDDIPSEFSEYDHKVDQLDVGKTGKVGFLRIKLEKDPEKNKTVVTDQYSQFPLYIQKALHYDEFLPSMANLFIMSPSGGIIQGDRYRVDITLTNQAVCHITTQGATRIYKMNSNYATQLFNITVNKNCYLEFIPDQLIPYQNSRYYQKVELNIEDSATLVYSEILTPGRVAMGEFFSYDICYLKTICRNNDKKIKFLDNFLLEPKKQKITTLGILGNYTVLATIYIVSKNNSVLQIKEKINLALQDNAEVNGGCTVLPYDCGLVVRLLGNSSEEIKTTIYGIIRIVRKEILGTSFNGVRKT